MDNRSGMLIPRLPLRGRPQLVRLNTQSAKLFQLIAPPGAPLAANWYGQETLIRHEHDVLVARSQGFQRYLFGLSCVCRLSGGEIIIVDPSSAPFGMAGLDIRLNGDGRNAYIERIYVMPEYRHQGIASRLVMAAVRDFPRLALDGKLTREGAAFFGYAQIVH